MSSTAFELPYDPGPVEAEPDYSAGVGSQLHEGEYSEAELVQLAADWKPQATCCWCQSPLHTAEILGSQCYVCPQPACHTRQLKFAVTVTLGDGATKEKRLLYLPLPRQTEAHEQVAANEVRRILYGGAAGGGKSKFLRWLAYSLCLTRKNFKVLLLRRTWPELEETHIQEAIMEEQLFGEDGGGVIRVTPSNRRVDFLSTGSYLKFGHCQDPKDMAKYLSTEYDLILFDELVTFTEKQYFLISSRARTPRSDGWRPMVVAGTNPGGPGAAWVTETFIHKYRDPKKYPLYNPKQHLYIKALLDDNPYVNETYVEFLMDLDPEMRDAYRWGNWDIFPGQYFKEFRGTKNGKPWHVEKLTIPKEMPRRGGMDWGYLRPGVILWAVVLPDSGRLYIEHEWVFDTTPPSKVAEGVKFLNEYWGITLLRTIGDPAMAIRNNETGESIFDTLASNGFPVAPGKHERVNGWIRLREWMRPWADGRPGLIISPECPYLIRTLPQLMQDETNLEDVDTTGEDHAADALRYMVMDYPAPVGYSVVKHFPPGTLGEMFQQVIQANQGAGVLGAYNVGHAA